MWCRAWRPLVRKIPGCSGGLCTSRYASLPSLCAHSLLISMYDACCAWGSCGQLLSFPWRYTHILFCMYVDSFLVKYSRAFLGGSSPMPLHEVLTSCSSEFNALFYLLETDFLYLPCSCMPWLCAHIYGGCLAACYMVGPWSNCHHQVQLRLPLGGGGCSCAQHRQHCRLHQMSKRYMSHWLLLTSLYIGHCIYFHSLHFCAIPGINRVTPHCLVQMPRSRFRTLHGKQLVHGWRVPYNQPLVYDTMYWSLPHVICSDV